MSSQVLAVTEQGTRVSVKSRRVVIQAPGSGTITVPLRDVSACLLFGVIETTSAFIRAALREGIDVSWFGRDGRYHGRLQGRLTAHSALRLAQFRCVEDEDRRVSLARSVIAGKLANQRTLILRMLRRHAHEDLSRAAVRVRQAVQGARRAATVDEARGFEGVGAAAYFAAFPALIRNSAFSFHGRSRRPPKDEVNACLSFGYALLASTVESLVLKVGCDPMLGCLHQPSYGRPSLVLDLMEEWRPALVDALVLSLVNRRELVPDDFEDPESRPNAALILDGHDAETSSSGAVYLGAGGRRILIQSFMKKLRSRFVHAEKGTSTSWAQAIEIQVRKCASFFLGEEETYVPFRSR